MSFKPRPRYYSIGQVAKETGLPAHTIRYWEQEFKQLQPRKNRSGRRMFNDDDIAVVRTIQGLLHDKGFTIKGAKEALKSGNTDTPVVSAPPPPPPPDPNVKSEREILLEKKLLTMKRHIKELIKLLN